MTVPMSRRNFLAAAVVVAASEPATADWRRRCAPLPPCPPCPDPGVRVRPDVTHLHGARLHSLMRGVAAMKALPPSDRRSWAFQAAIHGTADPAYTDPLFNQCQHGTLLFLPWHRGYLYFFERILRWAAGDPNLTLPFWDWTAHPVLPEPFRSPAGGSNPLYESQRKANDGAALPASVVVDDLDIAMGQTAFPPAGFDGFSPDLEGSPHGAVHVLVGGAGGLMSSVPTAAGDPIFWLHHANIDRLWDAWLILGGGQANPTDPGYLDTPYTFADETGGTVTVRVREIMSSAALGYRYEGVPNPAAPAAATWAVRAEPRVAASSAPAGQFAAGLAQVESKPLGFEERRVTQPTADGRIRLLDHPTADALFLPGMAPATLDAAGQSRLDRQKLVLSPRVGKREGASLFGDVFQAGSRGVLVDRAGHWPSGSP